ncbi:hypothetical protein Ddye_009886 [Dipteronia dyeriana]|uniref:Protein kinase domain-containing protein n=1 Tax=Dipteronia dyeriana TaxID=168575 RepID=A0AAD9XCA7_9ROSI|nr:hypothetical protein Ddye_009886 [Dipteronia dyeriana]
METERKQNKCLFFCNFQVWPQPYTNIYTVWSQKRIGSLTWVFVEDLSLNLPDSSKEKKKLGMASAGSSSAGESQFSVVEENPNGQISAPPCLKEFSFADLKTATSNFGHEALLGQGAYGRVYKGWLDEKTLGPSKCGIGMAVAIKIYYRETIQAFDQWQSEVNILGRRYHPNLIELLGYSWEDEKLVLVYEFMQKGSLENHLFRSDVFKPLSWDIRLRIAIGAARGLVFLHSLEKQIIYRDFKSSAILLDAKYNPKLSDFGLARLGPSGEKTHVTTRMMGTDGYVAPEYFKSGHLNVKSDVYSFGIVLLELLTGLRAADLRRNNDNLVKWLKSMLAQPKTLMDVRLKGQYSLGAACNATQLTLKCLEVNHKYRPSMKEVFEVLVLIEAMTSMEENPMVLEQTEAETSMTEVLKVLEQIGAVTSLTEVTEGLEHITVVTSMKEVREVLEQNEAVTSKKEVPEVLEHIDAIEEKPKNSNYRSRQSTAALHGQRSILHRLVNSLKEPFQCVSSKLNCMRI